MDQLHPKIVLCPIQSLPMPQLRFAEVYPWAINFNDLLSNWLIDWFRYLLDKATTVTLTRKRCQQQYLQDIFGFIQFLNIIGMPWEWRFMKVNITSSFHVLYFANSCICFKNVLSPVYTTENFRHGSCEIGTGA